jgi:hypothetical protein
MKLCLEKDNKSNFNSYEIINLVGTIVRENFSKNQSYIISICPSIHVNAKCTININYMLEKPIIDVHKIQEYIEVGDDLKFESIEHITYYLENNPNFVNYVDENGNTPLIIASQHGKYALIKLLFQICETNIHHVNNDKKTAMDYAMLNGHRKCVNLLLEYGTKYIQVAKGTIDDNEFGFYLHRYTEDEKNKYKALTNLS